ncbi:Integrase core domain [Candidatus Ornithobacterium hominis]|nr:Integrase core domain [Candidatus Ornithobacterium hominis]
MKQNLQIKTFIGTSENAVKSQIYVGFDVSDSLDVQSSLAALKKAIKCRKKNNKQPLIHHSNRGLQYCSTDYQCLLNENNILCSMTESYDPYANAVAERVNGILKQEFMIDMYGNNLHDKIQLVKDAIDKYNNLRPHYSCHYLTPQQMHKQNKIKIKTYKKIDAEKLSFQHQLN